jgi:hypothetical protein
MTNIGYFLLWQLGQATSSVMAFIENATLALLACIVVRCK